MDKVEMVLLSGGSGTRLWPLSNGVRSKQFLKLLDAPGGGKESMVQRIYRQIRESKLPVNLSIVTSRAQRDPLINQLGGEVEIIAEPERRDTFPAIALAGQYLKICKGCSDDTTVVVMPIDPYTEPKYFDAIKTMVEELEHTQADIVLMGIKPDGPSTKFGYIIPDKNAPDDRASRKVANFAEKPAKDKAAEYISCGALWNGGVFAFKLGYIDAITGKYIKADKYDGVLARYGNLPKISFDYEVVENAKSVRVVKFDGLWSDLGTWESLCREIGQNCIGKVVADKSTENTNIINELSVPVVCMGVKNAVIAASPDGIFVGDKSKSAAIKECVEKLERYPMYEERRWGEYTVLEMQTLPDGTKTLTKSLKFSDGAMLSYQSHKLRDEIWTCTGGRGKIIIDSKVSDFSIGDTVAVRAGQKHAIKAVKDLRIIEVQIGPEISETDVVRYPLH